MTKPNTPLKYQQNPFQEPKTPAHKTGRDLSLDLLKAFAILMVIFYHNGQLNPDSVTDNLLMLIPNAAVPCFFMASGAVFFHRPFNMRKHLARIARFYMTIIAWKAVYLLLYRYWGAPANGSVRALLSYLLLFQHLEGVGTTHFWFMDAMLAVMLVSPILYLCYHTNDGKNAEPRHSQLFLFLLVVLVLFNQLPAAGNLLLRIISQWTGRPEWNISALGEINPFSFRYSNYFTYYLLGALLMEYRGKFTMRIPTALTLTGTVGLFCVKYIQTGSFRWNGIYLESGYYWISTMFLATGLFLFATNLTVREASPAGYIAKYVGAATIGFFYLHIPLIFVLAPSVFSKLQPYNGWLVNLAESCLIIVLSLPIIWIGRKIPILRNLFSR